METELEAMSENEKTPWFYGTASLIVAFLCVGPFMLPLIWNHPTMSKRTKHVCTGLIAVITIFLIWSTCKSVVKIMGYYDFLLNI